MSHGVHAVQHEVEHQIDHEEHGRGKSRMERNNKKIALLISVIALLLAIAETLGKSAQTEAISLNIKASDTWNFFQAKTVRQTTLRTAAEAMEIEITARPDEAFKAAMAKQVNAWRATVTRYDSDPKEKDGRKELRAQALRAVLTLVAGDRPPPGTTYGAGTRTHQGTVRRQRPATRGTLPTVGTSGWE